MEIFVIHEGQQMGPFNEENIQKLLKSGGLRGDDLGWSKGLPGWLPINEVLAPGSERPSAPPPAPGMSGIRAVSGVVRKLATNKQKALLKFIGASFEEDITKLEAAEAISEALENPKLTPRFQKWGDEKLRLHPDYFQDEIDYRRANRVSRLVELCETDGADAVKGVTKAHVQVLVESLDRKHPKWDADPVAALWERLLPAIAEHFPPLMREGWKTRHDSAHAPEPAPSAAHAALRGIVYGVGLLVLILGGVHFWRDKSETPAPVNVAVVSLAPAPTATPAEPPTVSALPPQEPAPPAVPEAPLAALAPEVAPAPVVAVVPMPEVPAAPPASLTPMPTPASVDAVPVAPAMPLVPPAATTAAVAKNMVTITKPVSVQLQFGKVTLAPGTKMRLIKLEGPNVRVNFNNNVILIPLAMTDADPNAPAPAPVPLGTPSVPAPAVPVAPKPSSDL